MNTIAKHQTANITGLSHDGRGIAHIEGKTTFIQNALPGETVDFFYTQRRSRFDAGQAEKISHPSEDRVTPPCPHYAICGGCSLQHLASDKQITFKQQVLAAQLEHSAKTQPLQWLPPLTGGNTGYRHKARIGVKYVVKKGAVLVGFRERHNPRFLANIDECVVLHTHIGQHIKSFKQLIQSLDTYRDIPQLEIAIGEQLCIVIVRHLKPLTEHDTKALQQFADQHNLLILQQPKGPDSIQHLDGTKTIPDLHYSLPDYNVTLHFAPQHFTQVNPLINRAMIKRTIELLDPQPEERILDLFCGLGNFSLPIAKHCRTLIGVEGSQAMVEQASKNAHENQIHNAHFFCADLDEPFAQAPWAKEAFDKLIIDPPRSGALAIIEHIQHFQAQRIIYISCNPATLARDTAHLIAQGYQLTHAGVMDMFPHTSHVESIAVFERTRKKHG